MIFIHAKTFSLTSHKYNFIPNLQIQKGVTVVACFNQLQAWIDLKLKLNRIFNDILNKNKISYDSVHIYSYERGL